MMTDTPQGVPPIPPSPMPTQQPTPPKENWFKVMWKNPKKRWILILGGVVIIAGTTGIIYAATRPADVPPTITATASPTPTPTPTPAVEHSLLDGTQVGTERALRHPLAIMIENSMVARPQTGLSDASIVYESIVEGGITRYMAVYGPNLPDRVGPVRSARIQFVLWSEEYTPESAYYAHVGGSSDALQQIKGDKMYDLDQFRVGAKAFQRFPKAGLATEHTMYTFPQKLYEAAQSFGYSTESNFRPWKFKEDVDIASRPDSQSVTVPFSSAPYTAKFLYDKTSNSYRRQLAGKDDVDAGNKKQITPKNVIIQFAGYETSNNKGVQRVNLIAEGPAKILRDGKITDAKWSKGTTKGRTIFTDAATGEEIQFNRGQIWIAVPKTGTNITVQ